MSQVGRLLDFDVTVIDDRPSFANSERFPMADQIVVDDFEAALDRLPITSSTYVVLVTRGHVHDVRVLRKIVRSPAAYIGMIGSRRRVFAVFKLLHAEGVGVDALLRVHAPIGLDIKTETPGEIAVSVGAELLKVRRGGGAVSFSDVLREQYRYSLARDDPSPGLQPASPSGRGAQRAITGSTAGLFPEAVVSLAGANDNQAVEA
jgi:xanthine/CO dehydrogenase XdhC/CoxF family maturation factor